MASKSETGSWAIATFFLPQPGGYTGRSALGRLFEGGEGLLQHGFGVARPLVKLCLGLATPPRRELFHVPDFGEPCAGPARLQAVGPAHVRAVVGVRDELKAAAALG